MRMVLIIILLLQKIGSRWNAAEPLNLKLSLEWHLKIKTPSKLNLRGLLWSRQESNLHPRLRKPIYYPLYYETVTKVQKYDIGCRLLSSRGDNQKKQPFGAFTGLFAI